MNFIPVFPFEERHFLPNSPFPEKRLSSQAVCVVPGPLSEKTTFYRVTVKLQFPYELSFLSVFWITSNSNQKYMLDVVSEVFNRSGSPKTRHREASWLLNSFNSKTSMPYIWY